MREKISHLHPREHEIISECVSLMWDEWDLIGVSVDYWVDLSNNLRCQTSSVKFNVNKFVEKQKSLQTTHTHAKDLKGTLPNGSAH